MGSQLLEHARRLLSQSRPPPGVFFSCRCSWFVGRNDHRFKEEEEEDWPTGPTLSSPPSRRCENKKKFKNQIHKRRIEGFLFFILLFNLFLGGSMMGPPTFPIGRVLGSNDAPERSVWGHFLSMDGWTDAWMDEVEGLPTLRMSFAFPLAMNECDISCFRLQCKKLARRYTRHPK